MATTANYSWSTPDDSALVKDGASAIRALGTAIDTSMNTALGTKKAGMVLLNTTSFSAVSSQSFNNVFTSTYDNYSIVFDMKLTSGVANLLFRLRASGTDATAGNYFYVTNNRSGTSNPVTTTSSATSFTTSLINDTYPNPSTINVYSPNIARPTGLIGINTSSYTYTRAVEGYHTVSTSYDGFTLTIDASTITGKVSIYGYNA
jgi:hypothetical protein